MVEAPIEIRSYGNLERGAHRVDRDSDTVLRLARWFPCGTGAAHRRREAPGGLCGDFRRRRPPLSTASANVDRPSLRRMFAVRSHGGLD